MFKGKSNWFKECVIKGNQITKDWLNKNLWFYIYLTLLAVLELLVLCFMIIIINIINIKLSIMNIHNVRGLSNFTVFNFVSFVKMLIQLVCCCWWISFAQWLTGERGLNLFPIGTIVKDSYHQRPLTSCEHNLNLHRTEM